MNTVLEVIKYGDITNYTLYIPFRHHYKEFVDSYHTCPYCDKDIFYLYRDQFTNKLITHCYFCRYEYFSIDPLESLTKDFLKDKNSGVYEVCNTIYIHLLKFIEI